PGATPGLPATYYGLGREPKPEEESSMVTWTQTQSDRLRELEAEVQDLEPSFPDAVQRNQAFQELENRLVEA
ncbi:MAG TPA: pyrrolysine--tRNA(Pyl) ligase large subunit, partial [Syntrophobacteraceae bacterium]|nr:pyrrolysine--tRNA(Pyl) ligase large subunit [Syntrophobacteraceae bacterium]